MTMQCSRAGIQFIAAHEGFVGHVYLDAGGKPTIGYGHLLRPGESFPNGVTQAEAMTLLAADVAWAEQAVNAGVKVAISQAAFDALVSFAYNCGAGAFASSTLLVKLNARDYSAAADEFPRWDHVNGVPNANLLARRQAEQAMFLSGAITDPEPPAAA